MGLEDKFGKVPLRRIFRRFFEALFDPETGHDHDGVNSKTLSPAAVVENNSINTAKIQDGAVTAAKIAANAVTTEKIEDEAVTAGKLAADAVVEENIADGAVTTDKLADEAVTAAKLNADVAGDCIGLDAASGAINVKVDDMTIEAGNDALQLKAGGVDTAHLADDAVTSDKIADGAVTTDKIADSAALVALIGAGLGVVKTVAHDTEGSPITLLTADDAARACLVVALVGETLDDGVEFSIEDEDETALLDVTTDTAGDVLVGAGTLAANKALQIAINAGGTSAAGEVTVFVIAIPEA